MRHEINSAHNDRDAMFMKAEVKNIIIITCIHQCTSDIYV